MQWDGNLGLALALNLFLFVSKCHHLPMPSAWFCAGWYHETLIVHENFTVHLSKHSSHPFQSKWQILPRELPMGVNSGRGDNPCSHQLSCTAAFQQQRINKPPALHLALDQQRISKYLYRWCRLRFLYPGGALGHFTQCHLPKIK